MKIRVRFVQIAPRSSTLDAQNEVNEALQSLEDKGYEVKDITYIRGRSVEYDKRNYFDRVMITFIKRDFRSLPPKAPLGTKEPI